MSVHRKGARWSVRWRDAMGRNRSRSFDRRKDANDWDSHVRRLRQRGELARLDSGTETVSDFVEEWLRTYALVNLAPRTLDVYASMWDIHIEPVFGAVRLRDVNVLMIQRWLAGLERGRVGRPTQQKCLTLLSGVLQRAVEWDKISTNPARVPKLPVVSRERVVQPMPPSVVEAMRTHLAERNRLRDATLLSVLAYVGPRPSEALALRWRDVGERTLTIHATKTSRRFRSARLAVPVRADLMKWRLASDWAENGDLVFPRGDGSTFGDDGLRNWRNRIFKPAAKAAGIDGPARPYDLRHAAASLWLHEGRSVVEVAGWLGHSPTETLKTYSHVVEELSDAPRITAEEAIREARETLAVRSTFPAVEATPVG
ncbi:MAG: site-specific integrase [Solirubrobacteraceae bacterium]